MKEDIRLMIKELQYACRQSLYNGIAGVAGGNGDAGPLSDREQPLAASNLRPGVPVAVPVAKRQRRDTSAGTNNEGRSWDVVSLVECTHFCVVFHGSSFFFLDASNFVGSVIPAFSRIVSYRILDIGRDE